MTRPASEQWRPKAVPEPPVDAWELYKQAGKETRRLVPFCSEVPWSAIWLVLCLASWTVTAATCHDNVYRECGERP